MREVTHSCDKCGARISYQDWEDGLQVYGVTVKGSLDLGFDRKTDCGSHSTPHTFINGGEFCSTKCAKQHLTDQLAKATSEHKDWTSGVSDT